MKAIILYTTFAKLQDAREVANILITEKLAACANVFDGMESIYQWQGQVESGKETAVIFKTTSAQEAALMARLAELHPFETPFILVFSADNAYVPTLSWLCDSTSG